MKRILLAAAIATLAASPAYAGCTEDAQAQAQKIQTLTQETMTKMQAGASKDEQCSASKGLMDETKKLVEIYKTCKAELNLTDAQIQQVDQQVATGDQSYAQQCGG